ncbi:MFS transporter, partial [Streptococcus pneumoniae]|nr:MFS transporter [Streptococcus pneumoniae]
MKRYKTLFIKYPDSFQFLVFNILFYLSMSLSRSVHSIWFDLNGSLLNYSISYSAMAFSGMFAGILGRRINYFNLRNLIRIGVILYSIGLLLRLFPND